ncbi:protein phosphatase inhibitor 2 [Drosophila biarmipes]|uniref:protein phosphatase inhibitor 2 n=1 Tax=Drosophila biarmipes TaxID=125945 RepID=UPI0007E79C97|nr:protein phosphatase inhibitor 2 [Drosophila biarmipes]
METEYVKGILKSGANSAQLSLKAAKFDEVNILATFHPVGKDYGHMIIDEPKTPFVFEDDLPKELDTNALIEKLRQTSKSEMPAFGIEGDSDDSSADEDFPESVEEKVRRMEFESRRKQHYKEFFSVPLARRLIAEEFGESTTSECSIRSEKLMEQNENCCEDDQAIGGEGSLYSASRSGSYSEYRTSEPFDLEPGLSPSHHCYQKLKADIYNQPPEDMASLSHLHRLPSVNDDDLNQDLRVPHTSVIPSERQTVQEDKLGPKVSSGRPGTVRICKTSSDTRAGTSKKVTR